MISRNQFSLREFSLHSAFWYTCVLTGWPLIGYAFYRTVISSGVQHVPALLMVLGMVLVLEVLPIVQGRGHDPQGLVTSIAFTMAILFLWGVWAAIIAIALASILADSQAGKHWWKIIFNPSQYALSIAAAWGVMRLAGAPDVALAQALQHFSYRDLGWMALAWAVYFLVNNFLVSGVLTWDGGYVEIFADDIVHATTMTMAVLALSPLVVILALDAWPIIPLLLLPLLMLYYTAQVSVLREHEAAHDALTQLPNRTTLNYELTRSLATHTREQTPFGLMVIDVDEFKAVNDNLGHQVGDSLLVQIADRLRAGVRGSDVIARLGGDEFAVLVTDADWADTRGVAERILFEMTRPIDLDDVSVEVQLSIGVAMCPEHATDAAGLLRRADVAMYRAKTNRTGVEIYSAESDLNDASALKLVGELRRALDSDELALHYQPKIGRNREPIGVEGLLRWHHPELGPVQPDRFIALAERSGIMPNLTAWVVRTALAQIESWRGLGIEVPISVNISPGDLIGDTLYDVVAGELTRRDVPPSSLMLEITERISTGHLEESRHTLSRLREIGIGISLDDFGTGYSSLLRLDTLTVDEIKIDRAFVARLGDGPRAIGIVGALIGLAAALGVPSIAEGVETEEQMHLLDQLGCSGVQGWHVAKPMAPEVAGQWLLGRQAAAALPPPIAPVA